MHNKTHPHSTLRPRQNGRHFADDIFKCIFLNDVSIAIKISLKFVLKGPINNIPALVKIMAWRRSGDKPLSEPMMVSLLTHICVTRPQLIKKWRSCCRYIATTRASTRLILTRVQNPLSNTSYKDFVAMAKFAALIYRPKQWLHPNCFCNAFFRRILVAVWLKFHGSLFLRVLLEDQSRKSYNTPVPQPSIRHSEQKYVFLFWMAHCGIWDRCVVVNLVYWQ